MATPSSSFLKNRYWVLRHGKSIPNEKGLIVSSLENGMLEEYRLACEGEAEARAAGELFLKDLKDANIQLENVRICYSPFSRTSQTARIVALVLNIPFEAPQCEMIEDLRERYFGPSYELDSHTKPFEGMYHSFVTSLREGSEATTMLAWDLLGSVVLQPFGGQYPEIWDLDEKDPFERPEGGESAADVVSRLVKAMEKMETKFQGCAILVVSHGDPLQMLQNILHAAKDLEGYDCSDLASRMEAVQVPSVLSKHRKFALLTAELRAVL